jgi:hypothetical protein
VGSAADALAAIRMGKGGDLMRGEQSEVAQLLAQIETEYIAARRGMSGFAEIAKHAAITARLENMGRLHAHLQEIVGEDAIRLIAERLETLPE